jgi:hypothetical protein
MIFSACVRIMIVNLKIEVVEKKIHWQHYLSYAIPAAIIYCIPVTFYLIRANYSSAWLLYLGNLLFLFTICTFLFSFNRRRQQNASTVTMLTAGHITTVMGIVIACLLCFILLLILVPGLLHAGPAEKVMSGAPASTVKGKTNGLAFMLFTDAIFGNVVAGSSASIIFPFVLKRDQTREKVPRKQAEL